MATSSSDIAIVGLGCVLPDATSPTAAWANLLRGHSALRSLSLRTYDWSCYKRDSADAARVFTNPIGAEIGPHSFDWRKFKISPLDAQAINPMHLHVLDAGAQALEEVKNVPHASTGVFVGGTGLGWRRDSGLLIRLPGFLEAAATASSVAGLSSVERQNILTQVRTSMEERLRPVSDDGVVNSLASIAAGRLALRFDLRGPHAGVDAGFASGLAAVTTAVQLLRDGTIDLAVAGAASECITPLELIAFSQLSVLARNRVRPFDADADGTLLGEGVALFALKRLEDAVEHGERIYAVLRGTGAASDGRSKSLLAPSADGQALAMERAYADADVDPSTVGYVECHATGTPVGDASELHALAKIFGHGNGDGIALGSAKPFVGHLRGASGAMGMLRAVLALHHRTVPAQIGFERAHPNLELETTPFFVPIKPLPLESRGGANTARAAVSSFGLGGNNYHAVLEAWTPDARRSQATRPVSLPRRPSNEPLAIIGLGSVLPNADGVPAFWQALLDETDAAREVPADRWAIDRYFDPDKNRPDTTYTRVGCFVEPVPEPGKEFLVPPLARKHVDPGHMLAFRAAEEAVADAKLEAGSWDRSRTAVILGFLGCQGRRLLGEARLNFREFESELQRALVSSGMGPDQVSAILAETERVGLAELPSITEDTLPGYLGSFNAARIARRFDLRGPHFVVDSACASSLAALQAAARLLRTGAVDTVLLGGVWADGQPEFFVQNCRFSALSSSAITPFDERASGFVPGEGAAVLVLRRLADAERDGQRVHALVRAIEGSTDGAAGRSIYSPSAEGESLAMKRALDAAGVSPEQVDYVECHGTGTALGDVTEIEACTRAYGNGRRRPLLVGSVKSNIGHLMAGAGAASLLKTTLAIREGTIPASIKVQKLNPKIDFSRGPVEVVTQAKRWESLDGLPRRAGVSGFGLGGSNFHALLEEYRPPRPERVTSGGSSGPGSSDRRTLPIATAAGSDLASCARTLSALASEVRQFGSDHFWTAIAKSQVTADNREPYRLAVVAETPETLTERLRLLNATMVNGHELTLLRAQGIFVAHANPNERVAAVFPGQGPQYPNMLRSAAAAFPGLALTLDRIDRAYESLCGRKLRPSFFTDDTQSYLQSDEDIHCAVFAVNVAIFELLRSYGARFDAVMGQSAGELSALVAAQTISLEDGLRAIRERTLAVLGIKTLDPGRMVTLSCGAERALTVMRGLPGYAAVAADNAPSACIVSGNQLAIAALLERTANEGIEANVLPVSHGYHSQLIEAARPRYREALDTIAFSRPQLELFSSITGGSLEQLPLSSYPAILESQFVEPVRLRQVVTSLHQSGVRVFVECGPKWPLKTFIGEILAERPHVAQATIHPKVGEVEQLHRALACLFVHRVCALSPVMTLPLNTSNTRVPSISTLQAQPAAVPIEHSLGDQYVTALRAIRELAESALQLAASRAPESELAGSGAADCSPPESVAARASAAVPKSATPATATLESSSSIPAEDVRKSVHSQLVGELVKRTGYPEEMLEPTLDLEAELGIDTVKQVASLAAVREIYGLSPDPKFRMQDARTLQQAVDYLVGRVSSSSVRLSASALPVIQPEPRVEVSKTQSSTETEAIHGIASATAVDLTSRATPVTVVGAEAASIAQSVRQLLVAEIVTRTGYPEDMLELDLDLEAELGIDTVKQVAAMAAVREKFGLPPDPRFRMQDARTLRQAVNYLAGRMASVNPPSTTLPSVTPPSVRSAVPSESVARRDDSARSLPASDAPIRSTATELAADASPSHDASVAALTSAINDIQVTLKSLALLVTPQTLSTAPPGAPSATAGTQQVATNRPGTSRSVYPEVLLESLFPQAGSPSWNGEGLEVTGLAVTDADSSLPVVASESTDHQPLHAHDAAGQIVAHSRVVRTNASSSVPPELLDAARDARTVSNDSLLREYLDRSGRAAGSSVEWAHAQGFVNTVGGARVPNDCANTTRGMLSLIGSAYDVASFAWFSLTGALHSLSAIERICFHRIPNPGDEMLVSARMARPESGFWRADVAVFNSLGELFAEFSGVEGAPISNSATHFDANGSDPASRAWRHFAKRMGRPLPSLQELTT